MTTTDLENHGLGERPDCAGAVIEHANGARVCTTFGESCVAVFHDGDVLDCVELDETHVCPPPRRPLIERPPAVTWSLPSRP